MVARCSTEPEESNPVDDKIGEFCNKNQNDPNVWFLAGTFGGKAERTCTIPVGKAILFPIINDLISFAEYTHLKTESELRSYAKSDLDEATIYKAIVDGGVAKFRKLSSTVASIQLSNPTR